MEKLPQKPKIFICYAKQDAMKAEEIFDELNRIGIDPWLDKKKLLLGDDWKLEIEKAVKESDAFLVLLRPEFEKIGFRQQEIRWAIEVWQQRPMGIGFIIPFIIQPCKLPIWCQDIHAGGDLSSTTNIDDVITAIEKHCKITLTPESERRREETIIKYGPSGKYGMGICFHCGGSYEHIGNYRDNRVIKCDKCGYTLMDW